MSPDFYSQTMEHGMEKNEKAGWLAQKPITTPPPHPTHTHSIPGKNWEPKKSTVEKRKCCSFQMGKHNGKCKLKKMNRIEEAVALNNTEPGQGCAAQASSQGRGVNQRLIKVALHPPFLCLPCCSPLLTMVGVSHQPHHAKDQIFTHVLFHNTPKR